jgi:hypothetical protein
MNCPSFFYDLWEKEKYPDVPGAGGRNRLDSATPRLPERRFPFVFLEST